MSTNSLEITRLIESLTRAHITQAREALGDRSAIEIERFARARTENNIGLALTAPSIEKARQELRAHLANIEKGLQPKTCDKEGNMTEKRTCTAEERDFLDRLRRAYISSMHSTHADLRLHVEYHTIGAGDGFDLACALHKAMQSKPVNERGSDG